MKEFLYEIKEFSLLLCIVITVLFNGCGREDGVQSRVNNESMNMQTKEMMQETSVIVKEADWSQDKADQFYEELKSKMTRVGLKNSRRAADTLSMSVESFKAYLVSQGIDSLSGFEKELPQLTEEEVLKILSSPYGIVKKDENNNYEMEEDAARAFQCVSEPYTYLKITASNGRHATFYFHDTAMATLYTQLDYDNLERISDPEEKVWMECDYMPAGFWWPIEAGLAECEYEFVNRKTNESVHYKPLENETADQIEKKVRALFMDAKQQSEDVNRELRKTMIFESVKRIIDNTGSNVETAKMVYEDLCWTAWKDIKSVSGFNKDARTLTFFDFDGKAYTGYLNKNNNLWKVRNQNGEIIYQGTPNDSRKMSLADLAIQ